MMVWLSGLRLILNKVIVVGSDTLVHDTRRFESCHRRQIMKFKQNKPFYRRRHRNELIEEVTGSNPRAFQALMRRHGFSVKEAIEYLILKKCTKKK